MKPNERLAKHLEDLDLTNVDASRLCGVSEATVYRWLNGRTLVPLMALRLFALLVAAKRLQPMLQVSWSDPEVELQDKLDGVTVTVEVET